MGKYTTIIGERVDGQIEDLKEFYAAQKSGLDTDFLAGLWDCLEELEENPRRWQFFNTQKEGIRRAIIRHPQTIVFYRIIGNEVHITNIIHSRSKRPFE